MGNKKFLAITLSSAFVLAAVMSAVNIAANIYEDILYSYVGRGTASKHYPSGSENWDTNYYEAESVNEQEAHQKGADVTRKIAEEGVVLLKNKNDCLPLTTSKSPNPSKDKKITLLGRRSVNTVFSGSGSGAINSSFCTTLETALEDGGYSINEDVLQIYKDHLNDVKVQKIVMDNPDGASYQIGEFPHDQYFSDYTSRDSFGGYTDAAIVVLGRQGGEGYDFTEDMKEPYNSAKKDLYSKSDSQYGYYDENYTKGQNQLQLNKDEKDLIEMAKLCSDKVIVILNCANVMEVGELQDDPDIDSIVYMGCPGFTGTEGLTNVLNGTVSPSGHTVDTWERSLSKDPTSENYGSYAFSNITADNGYQMDSYTMDYEEGIYLGYRYYETADDESKKGNYSSFDYDNSVVYPFGYGLTYTSFSWELDSTPDLSSIDSKGTISIDVKVTNTGNYPAKDVVQLYYSSPYESGGVEKASKVLGDFKKTPTLYPASEENVSKPNSCVVTLSLDVEDMASYDYKRSNSDGSQGAYVLDKGNYGIFLQKDAHNVSSIDPLYWDNSSTVVYDSSNPRQSEVEAQTGESVDLSEETKSSLTVQAATNRFSDVSDHFVEYDSSEKNDSSMVNLSRSNFASSYPTAPSQSELNGDGLSSDEKNQYKRFDSSSLIDKNETAPSQDQEKQYSLVDMRGLTYDDPKWDTLLNQMSTKELYTLVRNGYYSTMSIASIDKPATDQRDGPAGLMLYASTISTSANGYSSATLVSSTYNVDLAEEMGEAFGEEALTMNPQITGVYAHGVNLHHSAFGGRNFEYYSEDPLLAGKMASGMVSGTAKKGLVTYMKHFAFNDQDTHRMNGMSVFVNEQAARELYLKAFEIAFKEPTTEIKYISDDKGTVSTKIIRATMGCMTSFNRIGATPAGTSSALLNDVARGEWGFQGTFLSDCNIGDSMIAPERMLFGGGDQNLSFTSTNSYGYSYSSATVQNLLRKACKNILYTNCHNASMNGLVSGSYITYSLSWWQWCLVGCDVLFYGGSFALVCWACVRIIKSRKKKDDQVVL